AEIPAVEPQPVKPRRARRTRPAGPPPEEFEDIGTVALTLDSGETVRVEAVVGNGEAQAEDGPSEPGPDQGEQLTVEAAAAEASLEEAAAEQEEPAPKRRRTRRPTRAEKIEAAKADATD